MALTTIPVELVQKSWAKMTYESGLNDAFFNRFMGNDAKSIVHRKTELTKEAGTSIIIPLLMPLVGAAVLGDNTLEGNEDELEYRDFRVSIDQIRKAVRLKGRFEEQKTQQPMRQQAKTSLSAWLSRYIDTSIFSVLTGVLPVWTGGDATKFPFELTQPSADRTVFGGTATAESGITTADVFNADLIGKAKRAATMDELTAVRPVMVDGHETYVMVINPSQARDLRNDPKWLEAQQHANIRGEKNPIFSGAMGIYEGVVIHEHNRVPVTETGASGIKVGHAVFLGAQAVTFAEGKAATWKEDTFDYDNQYGVAIARIFGIAKSAFKYDGVKPTDFGVVNVMTAAQCDHDLI